METPKMASECQIEPSIARYVIQIKIGPYLDNFLTNPYTFLAYSGESDPKSPEYGKKV